MGLFFCQLDGGTALDVVGGGRGRCSVGCILFFRFKLLSPYYHGWNLIDRYEFHRF